MIRTALVALLLMAAPAQASPQSRLDDARERWRQTGLTDYEYDVQRYCFCRPLPGPIHFEVRDRKPATHLNRKRLNTVPHLFRLIRRSIERGYAEVTVEYAKRGFPRSIFLDQDERLADEEETFEVSNLRGL